jgi:hypothetical protein
MKRILLIAALFALASPARADMYPDASNAKLPDARTNLAIAPHVATNAALTAASTANYPSGVWRDDFSAGLGAPPLFFFPQTGNCAAASMTNDGGHCVNATGGSFVARTSGAEDVRSYGAACTNSSDEHVVLQTAINSVASRQGILELFSGATCNIGTTGLVIGNGSASAISTLHGFILRGASNPTGNGDGTMPITGARIEYTASGGGNAITVNGPLTGWGLQNLRIECVGVNLNAVGVAIFSASWGDSRNLSVAQCGRGIFATVQSAIPPGVSTSTNNNHNSWRNIAIDIPNINGALGIQESGIHNVANTDFSVWDNVYCSLSSGTAGNVRACIILQVTDSGRYTQIHVSNSGTASDFAVIYDYTVDSVFPSGTVVDQLDSGTNIFVENKGTPSTLAPPNYLINVNLSNSTPLPTGANLANLYVMGVKNSWTPTVGSDGTALTPSYLGQIGTYTMNGPNVDVSFYVAFTFTGGTGNMLVKGLPINVLNDSTGTPCVFASPSGWAGQTGYTTQLGKATAGTTNIAIFEAGSGKGTAQSAISEFSGTVQFIGQCSYTRAQQ